MSFLEGIAKVPASSLILPAGACIAGVVVGGLIVKSTTSKSTATDKLPEKWVKVGEIKELNIYPVKSLSCVPVNEAIVGRLGLIGTNNPLLRDRVFAVTNPEGACLNQRHLPILALVQAKIDGSQLMLSYTKDASIDIAVDIPRTGSSDAFATLFGEKIKVVDCGDKVAAWFSQLTDTPGLRLMYHISNEPQRVPMTRRSRFHTFRENHTGALQDETSYMLLTDESVDALNAKLEKPVSHRNFRPSIVVAGAPEPFSEDFWGFIKIGGNDGVVLKAAMPCQRCKLTTVDPDTGTFRTDGEPLSTLYKMKRPVGDERITKLVSKSAIMGAHFGIFDTEGTVIRIGDPVYAALV